MHSLKYYFTKGFAMKRKKLMVGSRIYNKKNNLRIWVIILSLLKLMTLVVEASENNGYIKVEGNNYQGRIEWKYEYIGTSQSFSAPVSGIYRFEVYGAQGSGYESHIGGYGGKVEGTIKLEKDEIINIIVGGTDGYNGGGTGVLTNGGGATQIEKEGVLIAIAGGGGGATNITDGNAGGSSAGTNNKFLDGDDSDAPYSAGGGGGYVGGNSGYTSYHNHIGNETDGGQCYSKPLYHVHTGNNIEGNGCYSIPINHEHQGESKFYGGCYTYINYHEHQGSNLVEGGCYTLPRNHEHKGNRIDGGACYTTPVIHKHSSSCPIKLCLSESFTEQVYRDQQGNYLFTYYYCDSCKFGYTQPKNYCDNGKYVCEKKGTVEYYELSCNMSTNTVESYELGCGMLTSTPESYSLACEKTEESIDYYEPGCGMDLITITGYQKSCNKIENESIDDSKAAFGGSNYYNGEVCIDAKSSAGVNGGDGCVALTLVEVDGATIAYYGDEGALLKKVTVAKKESVFYPFSENPTKATDEKYSYTFAGWDNMETKEVERYSNEETVQNTSSSINFKAVYDKHGKTYTVVLDGQSADSQGTTSIQATYGQEMDKIEIPYRNNYIFAGYYSQPQGVGNQYYNSAGEPIGVSDIIANITLYAHWIQPIAITKQPIDIFITTGYRGIVVELDTEVTANGDFDVKYQWYTKENEEITAITGAFAEYFIFPENYAIGKYNVFCDIKVTDKVNQHSYTTQSNMITVQIMKGTISDTAIFCNENNVIYDGKYHSAIVEAKIAADYTIYYAKEEMTLDNYINIGQKHPLNFKDAGTYEIYYYITSEEYEDYRGKIEYIIQKAKPEILVYSKNVSYTGDVLSIDDAKVLGVNNTILEDCTINYTYYIDIECTQKTSEENGAKEEGRGPSMVGSYFVLVSVEESANYTASDTTVPVMLNVFHTTVNFEIKGYNGIYDKMKHGITVDAKNNGNITFYFSSKEVLTPQNYKTVGDTVVPSFVNAGTYKVYYLVENKLIGKLNSYIPGEVSVIIQKAKQYITSDNYPKLNTHNNTVIFPKGGEWEYKSSSNTSGWRSYAEQDLSEGIYCFRLAENENYYASEAIIIHVNKPMDGGNNNTDNSLNDNTTPETEPEEEENVVPEIIPEKNPELFPEKTENPEDVKKPSTTDKEENADAGNKNEERQEEDFFSDDNNQNGIPDQYEKDENGNGIPDFFEIDHNGNGIPDYFEWDMNGNGISDYLEDKNRNGIPDFLEWRNTDEAIENESPAIIEIIEEPVSLGQDSKPTVVDKIKETVKEIMSEENVKIVVPCVTVGMIVGLLVSYLALILLSPFIKMRTRYCYFIETMLTGKTKNYTVKINTDVASIDETRQKEGIWSFGQLCKNEDYIITVQDKNHYSVGVIRLTFIKKRVFHEVIINRGIEIRIEQVKHGAKIHVR